MDGQLRVQLSEEGADAERLDTLTGYLRGELLQLDVEDVAALRASEAPAGSRAFDAVAVGGLLVALGHSADGLRSVVTAIREWLRRGDGTRRMVRLELDGDALELSEVSAAEQDRLIGLFVSRHAPRGDGS
jgi:hypothetical protein